MKIALTIARVFLGLAFVVFGLDHWGHFLPKPPSSAAGSAFIGAMIPSGYFGFIKALEVLGGLLILSGRFLPLGLLILGPILVNILAYDVFLDRNALPVGIVFSALLLFLAWANRALFLPFLGTPPAQKKELATQSRLARETN